MTSHQTRFRITAALLLATAFGMSATSEAAISRAKAGELSLHRIERMVTLRQLDEVFLTNLKEVTVHAVASPAPGTAAFHTQGGLYPGLPSAKSVMFTLDDTGRVLSSMPMSGADSGAPTWPGKDAVALMETAMHLILGSTNPLIAPYDQGLKRVSIRQEGTGANLVAVVEMALETPGSRLLRVRLRPDGTVLSGPEIGSEAAEPELAD